MLNDSNLLLELKHEILTNFVTASGHINGRKLLAEQSKNILDALYRVTACLDETYHVRARVQFVLEQRLSVPVCCVCGEPTAYNKQTQTFNPHCCHLCAHKDPKIRQKIERTCMERYGVPAGCMAPEAVANAETTNIKKYGVRKPFQSAEIQQKVVDTVRAMGVTSTALLDDVRKQQETTNLKKYGVKKPFESTEIQQKVNQTFLDTFNVKRYSMLMVPPESYDILNDYTAMYNLHVVRQKTLTKIGEELGTTGTTVSRYLQRHDIDIQYFIVSEDEKAVGDFVESLGIPIERNLRNIISPKELDIYVPSHNLAIEFCGVYWHGERQGKYRTYHKEKHSACKEKGIQLITMYDWEWNTRQHQVQQKLRTLLGKNNSNTVYARKCSVQRISTEQKNNFFDDYHVQGTGPGSINYGLFFENELVAAISIIDSSKEYVINRYATKSRVVGGFTKLLKFFQRNHAPKRIVSFADLRWSNGDMYEKAGFKLEAEIPPDYAYIIGGEPKHKFAFRHAHLANKLPMYDPAKSEWENMYSHGFDRIWDCGKLRYAID